MRPAEDPIDIHNGLVFTDGRPAERSCGSQCSTIRLSVCLKACCIAPTEEGRVPCVRKKFVFQNRPALPSEKLFGYDPSLLYLLRSSLANSLTRLPSLRPLTLGMTCFITLPRSPTPLAPSSPMLC